MDIVRRHPVLEDVLGTWNEALGGARAGYGGHAYRVFNMARRLLGTDAHDDTLAIASAFHDLGIWSDGTFDYLPPSVKRAQDYANPEQARAVGAIIDHHHSLSRLRNGAAEAFRRADLVDVSAGLVRAGLPREYLRELTQVFPYSGFHGILVKTALAWFFRHPLRPLPMLRLSERDDDPPP